MGGYETQSHNSRCSFSPCQSMAYIFRLFLNTNFQRGFALRVCSPRWFTKFMCF